MIGHAQDPMEAWYTDIVSQRNFENWHGRTEGPYRHKSDLRPNRGFRVDASSNSNCEQGDTENTAAMKRGPTTSKFFDQEPTADISNNHQSTKAYAGIKCLARGESCKLHEICVC